MTTVRVVLDLIHDLVHGVQSGAEYGGGVFPTRVRFLMLIPEWECDTFANAGSIEDGVYPDTLILLLTKTNDKISLL